MTSCIGSVCGGFWGIWKQSVSWVLRSEEGGWLSFARSGLMAGATRDGGGWRKSHHRLWISLPYVETFNSKAIKGFVPELRCRYVFFVFRNSCVLRIYVMNIQCTFHISVSWIWYNTTAICVLFNQSGLNSIWPLAYRLLSMSLLVTCWCLSRLMRHCFLRRWSFLLVSKNYRFMWKCRRRCEIIFSSFPSHLTGTSLPKFLMSS